jgi:hypothetical protein
LVKLVFCYDFRWNEVDGYLYVLGSFHRSVQIEVFNAATCHFCVWVDSTLLMRTLAVMVSAVGALVSPG